MLIVDRASTREYSLMGYVKAKTRKAADFSRNGFTLVELMIVISLATMLMTVSIPLYNRLYESTKLRESTSLIIEELMLARVSAKAGMNRSAHGVYFEINPDANDRVIAYQGESYAARDTGYDRVTVLESGVSLSTTFPQSQVNFSAGLGIPDISASLVLDYRDGDTKTIEVKSNGVIMEIEAE